MKFEYINLLNEDVTHYVENSISPSYFKLRLEREKEHVLQSIPYIRDCRSRLMNFSDPNSKSSQNVLEDGSLGAVNQSFKLGKEFVDIAWFIIKYFCVFEDGKLQLRKLTINSDKSIEISEGVYEEVPENLFFVFDLVAQYRYSEYGMKVLGTTQSYTNKKGGKGGRIKNLLLTNDSSLEEYKICSLSKFIESANTKPKKIKEIIKRKNQTAAKRLLESIVKSFEQINTFGVNNILNGYKKISWGCYDFINQNDFGFEQVIKNNKIKAYYDEDLKEFGIEKDVADQMIDNLRKNRFYYIGWFPSQIFDFIKDKENDKGADNKNSHDKDSFYSNLITRITHFNNYANKVDGKKLDDKDKGNISSLFDYAENGIKKIKENNVSDETKINEILTNLDNGLFNYVKELSLLKDTIITAFKATIEMLKHFLNFNNQEVIIAIEGARDKISEGVQNSINRIKLLTDFIEKTKENHCNEIKTCEFVKFTTAASNFKKSKNNQYRGNWYKDAIDKIREEIAKKQRELMAQALKEGDEVNVEIKIGKLKYFMGTNYSEPNSKLQDNIAEETQIIITTNNKAQKVLDDVENLDKKDSAQLTNEELDKLSEEAENYFDENNKDQIINQKSKNNKKNNNADEEKGDSSTPLNDSYIIRRGDRVYDSSYLHRIVKGRFNVSRNTTLNESNRKTKVLRHQWDQAYNFLNEAVNNLPIRRKFRH